MNALDLSLFNLHAAKQQLGKLEDVKFIESNAEHMAIENESQDVVTCNFVLSGMPLEVQVRWKGSGKLEGRPTGKREGVGSMIIIRTNCQLFNVDASWFSYYICHERMGYLGKGPKGGINLSPQVQTPHSLGKAWSSKQYGYVSTTLDVTNVIYMCYGCLRPCPRKGKCDQRDG